MRKDRNYPKALADFQESIINEALNDPNCDARGLRNIKATLSCQSSDSGSSSSTPYDVFVQDMFGAFSELFQSYEGVIRMVDIARLRFRSRTKVTRLQFIKFITEASLNEFYIFNERIESFLTKIERKYKGDPEFNELRALLPAVSKLVSDALRGVVELRGEHVHSRRYSSDDTKLRRAGLLELVVVHGGVKKFRTMFRLALVEAERQLVSMLIGFSNGARKIMTVTFQAINPHLLDASGRLRVPARIRRRPRDGGQAADSPTCT